MAECCRCFMNRTAYYEEFDPIYFYKGSSQNWHMRDFHYHKNYEIILFMSDGASLQIENRLYSAQSGDLFLINDREFHKTIGGKQQDYTRYVLMFYPELFKKMEMVLGVSLLRFFENHPDNFNHKINLKGKNLSDILELFRKIDLHYSAKDDDYNMAHVNISLMELLLCIQNLYEFFHAHIASPLSEKENFSSQPEPVQTKVKVSQGRIDEIKGYIQTNIGKKLMVEDIAQYLYMNKYYLSHYFKHATGFTLSEYIKFQKIATAKNLLKKGNSVTSVALLLGYSSESHFIHAFKMVTGTTPKKFAASDRHSSEDATKYLLN